MEILQKAIRIELSYYSSNRFNFLNVIHNIQYTLCWISVSQSARVTKDKAPLIMSPEFQVYFAAFEPKLNQKCYY